MIVAGAYFVSRILGYVRVVVITNEFGASAQLDAYFAAFRVPDTIFQLVAAGAFGSSMVPVLLVVCHSVALRQGPVRRTCSIRSTWSSVSTRSC